MDDGMTIAQPKSGVMRQFLAAWLAVALAMTLADARADIQPLEDIRAAARDFLASATGEAGSGSEIEVGRLDARLRLQRCSVPLSAWLPQGSRTSGHTAVGVRCDGALPWTLFVPAIVRHEHHLVVAARPIARGSTLGAADVSSVTRLLPNAPGGVLSAPEAAVGQVAMRDIPAGSVLNANQLKAPQVVRRGQSVTLSLASGPVAVRVAGTAMKDGSLGERIPVRNLNSNRVVEGVVLADGVVEVSSPRPQFVTR